MQRKRVEKTSTNARSSVRAAISVLGQRKQYFHTALLFRCARTGADMSSWLLVLVSSSHPPPSLWWGEGRIVKTRSEKGHTCVCLCSAVRCANDCDVWYFAALRLVWQRSSACFLIFCILVSS